MNKKLGINMNTAWAWYDPINGNIKHVTFIKDQLHNDNTIQIEIDCTVASDIMLGVTNLSRYKVIDTNGVPTISYIEFTLSNITSIFWSLDECIPFDKNWVSSDEFSSPIRILSTITGFDVFVVSYTTNGKVYVTLKDDPTWLIQTLDISTAIKKYGLGPIPIELDSDRNYSIYVRYNAA